MIRNRVKSKNITGLSEKMAKRNEDETENAVSDRKLKVHCFNIGVTVLALILLLLMEVKRFWPIMMKISSHFRR